MAGTGNRKTRKSSKTTSRKTSTKSKNKASEVATKDLALRKEITILFILALAILLFISNFTKEASLLVGISNVMFGLFGITAYIFPIFLFLGITFAVSNMNNLRAKVKFFASVFVYFFICTLIGMVTSPLAGSIKLTEYYISSSEFKNGGGFVGGLFSNLLVPLLGMIGTYIVMLVFIIIGLVIITEKSFLNGVKKGGNKVYSVAKEDAIRLKEAGRIRSEEKKQEKRMNKKIKGVAITKIEEPEPSVEEVHEITMDYKQEDLPVEIRPEFAMNHMPIEENTGQVSVEIPENIDSTSAAKIEVKSEGKPEVKAETKVEAVEINLQETTGNYIFPPLNLLSKGTSGQKNKNLDLELKDTAMKLEQTLQNFGVGVTVTNVSCGPAVTRYELQPEQGVKVSKIVSLADDIKLNLAAADIRIEAPIPGKAAVGIEVPNKENMTVMLRELLESDQFVNHPSKIAFTVGKDIGGQTIVTDIGKMPHLLIAGATGSGKSVCINTLIMSILYKADPKEVKLIMIDPKVVELSVYNGIPHLLIPVVTDPKKAAGALNWAVAEMTDRYKKFADLNVRDLKGYNDKVASIADIEEEGKPEALPQIVIIVDELADLMMVAPGEVEDAICRLAQMARAAGLHLVIATQRPSVNVITGLIKANVPSRIAFSVSSGVDSRTIIDMNGAEKLLGKGDMLFYPVGYQKPVRIQGAFVTDKEVSKVVEFLSSQVSDHTYDEEIANKISSVTLNENNQSPLGDQDDYFVEAGRLIIEKEKASIGMLQRMFKIGFNRAARIMDQLFEAGVVGPEEGTKPRKIIMSSEDFEAYIGTLG